MALWRRSVPKSADLDNMDSLALAAAMLETEPGMISSGIGSICYRGSDDRTFPGVENNARDLLTHYGASPRGAEIRCDDQGFKWLIVRRTRALHPSLVTDLRAASKMFIDNSFGGQLLCAMTVFEGLGEVQAALVYLYKRGTIYPFAPRAGETRDNRLELAIKNVIEGYAPVESDLTRWFPVWNAPGMRH